MTVFSETTSTSAAGIQTVTATNIPFANREPGSFLSLSDVSNNSQVDVAKYLGKPARRLLVTFTGSGSHSAIIKINSLHKVIKKLEERADNTHRAWGAGNSVTLTIAQNNAGTYQSYTDIGELPIRSFEVTALTLAAGQIDVVFMP